jgi:hypothetical protein
VLFLDRQTDAREAPFKIPWLTLNNPWNAIQFGGQGTPLLILAAYGLIWLLVLGRVLTRGDFDPVTRLTWVVVVIFVPVVGVVLYGLLAPATYAPREPSQASPVAGTPWENDPGHTGRDAPDAPLR